MKKTVLTFGLISGAILSAMMLITLPFHDAIGFDRGMIVGYTTMVLGFLLIFFGVRSYRDNVAGGTVRFGRALAVGVMIGAVASLCYVATWEIVYFNFQHDYLKKYQAYTLEKARAAGFEMRVPLDAVVSFTSRDQATGKSAGTRASRGRSAFEMSANDRRFLKSLRIAADEQTEKEVE